MIDDDGDLVLAAGSAGASRIRTALVDTLLGRAGRRPGHRTAIAPARFHVVDDTVHAEPGFPEDELDGAGRRRLHGQPVGQTNHYFGGVSAVGPPARPATPAAAAAGRSCCYDASIMDSCRLDGMSWTISP